MSTEPAPRSLLLRLVIGVAGMLALLGTVAFFQHEQWSFAAGSFGLGLLCLGWSLPRSRSEGKQLWQSTMDYWMEQEQLIAELVEATDAVRAECPCCDYPTLLRESTEQECLLCEWDASEVEVDLSLAEARKHFSRYRSAYAPEQRPSWSQLPPTAAERAAAEHLQEAYRRYRHADSSEQSDRWVAVLEAEGTWYLLRQERAEREEESASEGSPLA
jgi:hypothetical protein